MDMEKTNRLCRFFYFYLVALGKLIINFQCVCLFVLNTHSHFAIDKNTTDVNAIILHTWNDASLMGRFRGGNDEP